MLLSHVVFYFLFPGHRTSLPSVTNPSSGRVASPHMSIGAHRLKETAVFQADSVVAAGKQDYGEKQWRLQSWAQSEAPMRLCRELPGDVGCP